MTGSWEIWSVAAKWLMLAAIAAAIGGSYVLALARQLDLPQQDLQRYLRNWGIVGLVVTGLWFLLQVGAVNRSGFAGMFDWQMTSILYQSSLGPVLSLRLVGFAAFAAGLAQRTLVAQIVVAMMLCASFGETGHANTLGPLPEAVLSFHVLAAFLWIGALRPLLQLSRTDDLPRLQQLMHKFGTQALGIVAVLLLAGVYLATQLLQAPAELLTTAYGRVLLLKIFGVYGVLMFAAMNKLLLVPRLVTSGSALALQKSIRMEWIIALLVLGVTSWLTTITGPENM